MTSHHPTDLESGATDSVTSSPRSVHHPPSQPHDLHPRVRFMCSFNGKILPRPHDNQLRYVGGDTRIVAVNRHTTFPALLNKLSKLSGTTNISVKYQLPSEDLDALITVTTDEDVENMMEEYDRLVLSFGSKTARLRLFLFQFGDESLSLSNHSRQSSISSLLGGSSRRESWFFDALNGGSISIGTAAGLERGPSEASSIVSEVPDYLFGIENSDESHQRDPKVRTRVALTDNVSVSDPGSPAPVTSSPFCSTSSSVACVPDLPPVKTKPDNPNPIMVLKENQVESGYAEWAEPQITQPTGYAGKPMWQYPSESQSQFSGPPVHQMPIYYIPSPIPQSNLSVQHLQIPQSNLPVQHLPIRPQYVQQFNAPPGPISVGLRHQISGTGQVYGGPYEVTVRPGMNQQGYYEINSGGGMVPGYPGMMMTSGEDLSGIGSDAKNGRVNQ